MHHRPMSFASGTVWLIPWTELRIISESRLLDDANEMKSRRRHTNSRRSESIPDGGSPHKDEAWRGIADCVTWIDFVQQGES